MKEPEKKEEKDKDCAVVDESKQEKKITLTTDGKNVKLFYSNLNSLEIEMMLMKALDHFRKR